MYVRFFSLFAAKSSNSSRSLHSSIYLQEHFFGSFSSKSERKIIFYLYEEGQIPKMSKNNVCVKRELNTLRHHLESETFLMFKAFKHLNFKLKIFGKYFSNIFKKCLEVFLHTNFTINILLMGIMNNCHYFILSRTCNNFVEICGTWDCKLR